MTVTVYVPAAFTVGDDVAPPNTIPGPAQLKVAPGVVELAVIIPLGAAHVNTNGASAVTFGGTKGPASIITPAAQPSVSVTVKTT